MASSQFIIILEALLGVFKYCLPFLETIEEADQAVPLPRTGCFLGISFPDSHLLYREGCAATMKNLKFCAYVSHSDYYPVSHPACREVQNPDTTRIFQESFCLAVGLGKEDASFRFPDKWIDGDYQAYMPRFSS